MLSFVVFVVGVLVVGGLLFLAGSVLLGRGESQPPAELDRSPMELPDDRPVVGDDIRALRISPAVRGYRMTEVDWLLDQFAQTLDERDREIDALRERLAAARPSPHPQAGDEHPETDPGPGEREDDGAPEEAAAGSDAEGEHG